MKFPERIISQLNEPDTYKSISKPDWLHIMCRAGENQRLTILGSHHDTNSEHPYYNSAYFCFEDWEEATLDKPRIIIAEGEQDLWGKGATLRNAIENHYSEVGWQCFLADSYDIPIISGEPPNYGELAQLVHDGYPPSELLLYYGIREIPCWHRMGEDKEDFESYMEKVFAIYKRKLGKLALTCPLPDLGFSYPAFLESYKNHFNELPDPESSEMNQLYLKYTSAMNEESFSNQAIARVARRVMNLRDAHIGATYERYWQKGVSIFSWYGMNHTLSLSKHLQSFGEQRNIPRELSRGFSFQEGHICTTAPSPITMGPDIVQFDIQTKLDKRNDKEPLPWPNWLLNFDAPLPSLDECASIKNHFEERVTLPISETSYIHHIIHPNRQWNLYFFSFFKDLESYAEEYIDPIYADADKYMPLPSRELQPFEKTEYTALKRLLWAFASYSETLPDYQDFAGRLDELGSLIITSALTAGYERSEAALAYDAVSKHVAGLAASIENIRSVGLNSTEYLQYCLELLDHMTKQREPFELRRY